MQGAYTLNTPVASADTTLPIAVRDALLTGANGGVLFLFDTAFGFSYPGGALAGRAAAGAPANGAVVADISEHANGSFVKAATQTVGYAGGGFDFSTLAATVSAGNTDNHVKAPAAVWADIYANQEYMVVLYMRLPSLADWNANASILPFFASSAAGYSSEADPLTLDFQLAPNIQARRQTAVGAQTLLEISPATHYGRHAQVAFWRNAAGTGLRVKSAAGVSLSTAAAGAVNAANFSACQPRFGTVTPFTDFASASHRTCRNFRLYRGFIENLHTSTRDPVTALDADWERVQARIAASAAANGGTSLIFV